MAPLPPGVCSRKMAWEEVAAAVQDGSEKALGTLGRTEGDLQVYRDFREKVLEEYESMQDYVKIRVLSFDCATTDGGRLRASDTSKLGLREVLWRPNDFPYALEEGIHHDLVWCRTPLSPEELAEACKENCPGCEYVSFVNPVALASIPGVWHAHVMYRRKPE